VLNKWPECREKEIFNFFIMLALWQLKKLSEIGVKPIIPSCRADILFWHHRIEMFLEV
jgi:hypothetical protein